MAGDWAEFAWQGLRLTVPGDWNLGRVDGDAASGYARLDDEQIVRAEIEWRTPRRSASESVSALVDRYLANLRKKAEKADVPFRIQRRAAFLRDKRWLEGAEYETFIWEADFHAHNLALLTPGNRIVLIRVLSNVGEEMETTVDRMMRSLQDLSTQEVWPWSLYGLRFAMPSAYKLESHELKSGRIALTFQRDKHSCRVERISLARTLLRGGELLEWYRVFYKKELRDFTADMGEELVRGHPGVRVTAKPRSRWRQLMRPLPWLNPRPRQFMDARVWHCEQANKICIVSHLCRKQRELDDLTERVVDGYLCHEEAAATDPRSHAQLAARQE